MRRYLCFIYFFIFSYEINAQIFNTEISLKNLSGESVLIDNNDFKGYRVYAFYSTTCPLCINYTKNLREISDKFQNEVQVYLIFSGTHQRKGKIKKFIKKYNLSNDVLLDPNYTLSESLGATITPEVFLIKGNRVIYSGAIDDWVISLGQKKPYPEKFYLQDAIISSQNDLMPEITKVKAIGCFIR